MKSEINRRYRWSLREKVFQLYGTVCACCGEDQIKFLSIDHIDGKGADHRRKLFPAGHRGSGHNFYAKILALTEKDPNLQTLCQNCNTAKHYWGVCPHQRDRA